jgi:hypothetical protein
MKWATRIKPARRCKDPAGGLHRALGAGEAGKDRDG